MSDSTALRLAIDLIRVPSRVRLARAEPLPEGLPLLLRITAGDETAEREAGELTGLPRDVLIHAAKFFIEQILLCPEADSYRVLGADRHATTGELRRNMALLLRWLHPDLERQAQHSVFATRITTAWNDLKTAERRALFDRANPSDVRPSGGRNGTRSGTKSRKRSAGKRLVGISHPSGSCRVGRPGQSGAFGGNRTDRAKHLHGGRKKKSLLRRAFLFLLGEVRQ